MNTTGFVKLDLVWVHTTWSCFKSRCQDASHYMGTSDLDISVWSGLGTLLLNDREYTLLTKILKDFKNKLSVRCLQKETKYSGKSFSLALGVNKVWMKREVFKWEFVTCIKGFFRTNLW